jgi:hypothetical protein
MALSTSLEAAGRLDPLRAWTVGNERQLTGIAILADGFQAASSAGRLSSPDPFLTSENHE